MLRSHGRFSVAQGVVLFDRTVLDNLSYSLQKGYPLPPYLTAEVAATALSRIDHVLVLDQVARVRVRLGLG